MAVIHFMNILFAAFLGGWEVVVIFAAFLLLFGAKKLPELARGLGHGIREFKKATREVTDEIQNADTTGPSDPPRSLPPNSGTPPPSQPPGSNSKT
jgi:sec-independent protein translocase protein TatA